MSRQARISIYMNYSEIGYTHKLDQTTVTVEAPSMLAISTILASVGASSSTWVTTSFTTPAVEEGPSLFSSVDPAAHRRQPFAVLYPAQ
jgi:hypothetical protein